MRQDFIRVLLIEDEEFDAERVQNTIKLFEEKIKIGSIVSNGDSALTLINDSPEGYDVVIMDYQIAGNLHGEQLIKRMKEISPTIQIIVITKLTIDITDLKFARKLMDAGAYWFNTKYPNDIDEYIYQPTDFVLSIFNAYERKKLEEKSNRSNQRLDENINQILEGKKIRSASEEMDKVKANIERLANNDITVLISGPSGTGKELVAYNIHYKSKRKHENFVAINCGSLPNDLIESELFGYEKGSFTGAQNQKDGLFQLADKGTIFLDEIAELPLSAQVKLLRVIQEGEIDKIGRTKSIKVDVRILAATNKNLQEEVEAGRFREDLYYRLMVLPITLLPLKKRTEDIDVLVNHFLHLFSFNMGIETPPINYEARQFLNSYEWPGNVRELKNVVQRLLFIANHEIDLDDVKQAIIPAFKKEDDGLVNFDKQNIVPWKQLEVDVKTKYFKFVRENSVSDADAAEKLGLAPPNYHRMKKDLGL